MHPQSPARLMLRAMVFFSVVLTPFDSQAGHKKLNRPNIIVIMADDLGWNDLHCQGNELVDTPVIDELARQGIRFTDAYAAAPVCTPTRAAMMTGQAPARLHITNHAPGHRDFFHLPDSDLQSAAWTRHLGLEFNTIAERLKSAGYSTGFIGKWHLSHRQRNAPSPIEIELRPEHQGFDLNIGGCNYGGPPTYFEPYRIPAITPRRKGEYLTNRLADEAINFIRANQKGSFFLSLWNYSVHYPFEAPDHLVQKYMRRVKGEKNNPTYLAMIEALDTAIGKVLAVLDELDLADNTLVLFTSDNGAFGTDSKPLRGAKGFLYEGGIRVPWIVRWPGIVKPNTTCSTPVISMDTFPTILEAAKLDQSSDDILDGESIMPLLNQSGGLKRQALYFHYPNYAFHKRNRLGSAIRKGDYKLIFRYDDSSLELYDLSRDIGESENIANRLPAIAESLRKELFSWLEETNAQLPIRVSSP